MNFAAIDFETADAKRDSACSVGVAIVKDGEIVESFSRLIRPPRKKFSSKNIKIHGITWDMVKDQPDFSGVWTEIIPKFSSLDSLAAHYAPFDKSVVGTCCAASKIKPPRLPFLCSCKAAKAAWPELESHSLPIVCDHLGLTVDHHDAGSDAKASAEILLTAFESGVEIEKIKTPPVSLPSVVPTECKYTNEQEELIREIYLIIFHPRAGGVSAKEFLSIVMMMDKKRESLEIFPLFELSEMADEIMADGLITSEELLEFSKRSSSLLGKCHV